jgi:hypothetical protein
MKKMILSTRGKVFTLKTLDRLIEHTRLKEFRTSWDAAGPAAAEEAS